MDKSTISSNSVNSVNIYVVTHKDFNEKICRSNKFLPIAVGKKLTSSLNCNYIKDNTLDNISFKNSNYCELTAQYWIWKNDEFANIKGLCHYRRYFSKSGLSNSEKYLIDIPYIYNTLITKKFDAIVSKKTYSYRGVKKAYLDCGYEKDLNITRLVIQKIYPDYLKDYDEIMNGCWGYIGNMLITTSELFDQYSKWLFDILFEVEKRIDVSNYSQQEARIFGYISERLLGVWILHNNIKVKELRIINTEQPPMVVNDIKNFFEMLGVSQFIKRILFNIRGI